ncbi:arsenate reductase/protein-tyrosine-phosphatase family protein [Aestuariimicrobium ganziense]|uniref:arsenate reductase/protein-tyrosine-phosphatase family protein n=1 Tax=Aestuariimicrobium ganziense TaxID=2773677 RepID=UPI00194367C6|nr:hypothetical protein [Aestuariimicrobium ganziense]
MAEPASILFVCTANICRSPWAQLRAQTLMPHLRFESAGTLATPGNRMDPVMAATLPVESRPTADVAPRGSRPISYLEAQDHDLILTMDRGHRAFLAEEFPEAIRKTFTLGQFVQTTQSAPPGLALPELVRWAYRHRVRPSRETDVADPFGRGREAAERCAVQLEQLLGALRTVLPGEER